ncbi:MAG: hypothetical protein VYC39_11465 [Myxococcota bacterium]|nr:hypothetical protein [Myxococcota bacterium]
MFRLRTSFLIFTTAATLVACTQNRQSPELLVTDDVGIFRSEVWKTERNTVEKTAKETLQDWTQFLPTTAEDPKATWQVILNFEEALEGEAIAESNGKAPKDAVARRVTISARARVVTNQPHLWKEREFRVRRAKARNFRVLTSNQESVLSEVKAVLDLLEFHIKLRKASSTEVIKALESSPRDRRLHVVSEVRKRKLKETVPSLIKWLQEDGLHPEVEIELIGALIAIRDKRAVKPLIDSAQRRHEIYLTQIIFGIAEIGGKQAEAYLFTLKAGHPKPEIRKHAADALSEMLRRRGN